MKFYDFGATILITILVCALLAGSASVYFLGQDNKVEEIAEAVIEAETGIHVDLTPETEEGKP